MLNYSISRQRSNLGVEMVDLGRVTSTDDNDNDRVGNGEHNMSAMQG
jgi:hypothetical protein